MKARERRKKFRRSGRKGRDGRGAKGFTTNAPEESGCRTGRRRRQGR